MRRDFVILCFLVDRLRWRLTLSALDGTMSNLAGSYAALGRHQDALVIIEETLEFRRRVLPSNHPDIGAT